MMRESGRPVTNKPLT